MKLYFTFGSDSRFPFNGGWVEVVGKDRNECIETFRKHFPDLTPNVINCSFIYTEDEFDATGMRQGKFGQHRQAILYADNAKKEVPNGT